MRPGVASMRAGLPTGVGDASLVCASSLSFAFAWRASVAACAEDGPRASAAGATDIDAASATVDSYAYYASEVLGDLWD